MIIRSDSQVHVREGDYRGVWSGNTVTLRLPTRDLPVRVNDFTPRDAVDVIVVVVGGYMVAETLQKVEER